MSLEFDNIPTTLRTPGAFVEFSNQRAQPNLAPFPLRILYLGQKVGAGTLAALTPLQLFSGADGWTPFGRGSMMDRVIKAGFGCNSTTESWAIADTDPAGGVAAQWVSAITSAPTGAGTLPFYVAGQLVAVAIAAGMTTAQVATALAAAVNALPDLPITSTAAGSNVTHTVRWKGLTGNDIDFRLAYEAGDVVPAGLALNTTNTVAGSGAPNIAGIIAAMAGKWWNVIVCPWTDGATLAALALELANRRGPLEMMDGIAYSALKGSQGTLASFGASQNSPDLSFSEATGPTPTYERAARDAATIAYYGGIDPARPFQTLTLNGDLAPAPTEAFSRASRDLLLHDGISTHKVGAGGVVELERPITSYQVNAAGAPDASYLDVTTMMTLSYSRYAWRQRVLSKFPRHKLADGKDPVPQGQPIVTPKTMLAELIAFGRDMEAAGLWQDIDQLKALSLAALDPTDPSRLNMAIMPNFVSGLRVLAAQINFAF